MKARFEEFKEKVLDWNGDIESLAYGVSEEECEVILTNHNWRVYTHYSRAEFNASVGEVKTFLYFFIADWLMGSIEDNVKFGTDNLFRLWREFELEE